MVATELVLNRAGGLFAEFADPHAFANEQNIPDHMCPCPLILPTSRPQRREIIVYPFSTLEKASAERLPIPVPLKPIGHRYPMADPDGFQ